MITIRRAIPEDNIRLAEFGARTFYETFASDNTPENMDAYLALTFSPEKQARELSDPNITFFIAEHEQTIAGSVKLIDGLAPLCITGTRPIEIARLYVDKDFFRTGIGSRLMQCCFDVAASKGCDFVWLGVWEHNYRARHFYRKWKFQEVGSHIFQLGDDPQIDLLLQRPLTGLV
jgi:ribosomal protein S18 acetylase RimI-like enzyme